MVEFPYVQKMLAAIGINHEKYRGVGNMILGYSDMPLPQPAKRKDNYIYKIK